MGRGRNSAGQGKVPTTSVGPAGTAGPSSRDAPRSGRAVGIGLGVVVGALAAFVLGLQLVDPRAPAPATPAAPAVEASAAPRYVGTQECAACHAREFAAWKGSHHDLAMQPATEQTVLGDFAGATFTYAGVTSTFFRRDGKFFVKTDGADGNLADFEISHTFGVEPLQQYLIAFPDGRRQALGIAWDSRPRAAGGQRWFHLYPGQRVRAGERLHWTSIDQNWNYQCADCHSTNLRKQFDEKTNTFATTWTDVNVGCEACHGPGSNHAAWARKDGDWKLHEPTRGLVVALDERRGVAWTPVPTTGNAMRSRPRESAREVEVCARCHSRRGQITDEHAAGRPFTEGFRPALLEPGLYHVDGQMRDEVYNYGSFLQSRMNALGVTCSDCHDPHSQKLSAPGNGVCAQCHAPEKFDAAGHHRHAPGSGGAQCTACHMPTTTYMVVDPRHDHSMRIPRPDRSVTLGTPNACNHCHRDRKPEWAAKAVAAWFPEPKAGFQDFAEAFAGADRGDPAALSQLATIAANKAQPAIVRASAIARLARHPGPSTFDALRGGLDDPDALVRTAAVAGLGGADPRTRASLLARLAADPSRMVRMEVARVLAGTAAATPELERASGEFLAEQRFNSDRPEAHLALGNFAMARGDANAALGAYRRALAIDPGFTEAAINLADLHRATGDEQAAEKALRDALARDPSAATAHHALGLALARQKRMPEALAALSRASALVPGDARFAYVYAVALHDSGRGADAMRALDAALVRHPNDRELLFAAASYRIEAGDRAGALRFARRLQALDPGSPQVAQFVRALEGSAR